MAIDFQSGWVSKVDAAAEGRKLGGEGAQEKEVTSPQQQLVFQSSFLSPGSNLILGAAAALIYTPHNNDNSMMCVCDPFANWLFYARKRSRARSGEAQIPLSTALAEGVTE